MGLALLRRRLKRSSILSLAKSSIMASWETVSVTALSSFQGFGSATQSRKLNSYDSVCVR